MLQQLASQIDGSALQRGAVYLLSEIRGFPPIIQTVHLLAISAVMGSVVLLHLRVLGLAVPSQSVPELTRRLLPWTWWALPFLAISGGFFVFARPRRYAGNPIFRIKFVLIGLAVLVTFAFHVLSIKDVAFWERSAGRRALAKVVALVSVGLWVSVVLAGRWIAYVDYLIPQEE